MTSCSREGIKEDSVHVMQRAGRQRRNGQTASMEAYRHNYLFTDSEHLPFSIIFSAHCMLGFSHSLTISLC